MTPLSPRPADRIVLAALLLGGFCAFAIATIWNVYTPDLSALFMAGHLWATGQQELLYAAPPGLFGGIAPEWKPLLPATGFAPDQSVLPFVYPPLWAALLALPAQAPGPQGFSNAAALVQLPLLAGSVLLAWRLSRRFSLPALDWTALSLVLLATSLIAYIAVAHLQPQIAVTFLILLAFERYASGRPATGGGLLALAAMLKLAPVGLVLIFLLDRNWRALAGFAAVAGLLLLASLSVAGWDLHFAFLDSVSVASAGVFISSISFTVEIALHAAGAALGLLPPMDFTDRLIRIEHTPLALELINKLLLLCAIAILLRRSHNLDTDRRLVARLMGLSLLIALFGPLGWIHYYLVPLLLLPAFAGLLPRGRGLAVIAVNGVLTSWPLYLLARLNVPGDLPPAGTGVLIMLALFATLALAPAEPSRSR